MTTLKIAIIGSGPAGCYVAERLGKKAPGAVEVDVFDRLPTPFGLVRSGVAPDHQSIKMVSRVMAKALSKPEVRFFGHVAVGEDIALDDLRAAYDAVVLAIGAAEDRKLGIPGDDLPGVVGSGVFTRWYNDHPDAASRAPDLDGVETVAVIGNGNVAVDVTRMLAKQAAEMAASDLSPDVTSHLEGAPIKRIAVIGRRDAANVKFTPAEVRELGELAGARVVIDPADVAGAPEDADSAKAYEALQELAAADPRDAPVGIHLMFHLAPDAVLSGDDGRVSALRLRRTVVRDGRAEPTDETLDLPTDLVIPCIGYTTRAFGDLPMAGGRIANEDGCVVDGKGALYVVGWAKRGPSGTIGTNRTEAHAIADRILEEIAPADKPGRAAVEPALAEAGVMVVDWDGWGRIEAAETARADEDRVRRKFPSIAEMLDAARDTGG